MSEVTPTELSEDIEVVGPGQMLGDARKKLKLSIEQVADKLNFRICQVKDLEADVFDKSIPETFTRGYLLNYAKLVGVSAVDVIASYEALGVAKKQGAEMQSFSKITEKEAQHSRLMWISYLIIIGLVTLSVVYYFQDAQNQQNTPAQLFKPAPEVTSADGLSAQETESTLIETTSEKLPVERLTENTSDVTLSAESDLQTTDDSASNADIVPEPVPETLADADQVTTEDIAASLIAKAIFTFAGDCWVNIHDSTGERIAYGIKKSGYVMELTGQLPFEVTIGKPELVSITLNGKAVDLSKYNSGNIAKFTLPETPES